jgi:tRNA A-37 threonylcarbamoyl transferase component Bud32
LRSGNVTIVKDRPHRKVYRVDLAQRSVYVKQYRAASWRDAAKTLLRGSAARREWRKSLAVAGRGLPTARVLALGEGRRGRLKGGSLLVAEAIADSLPLDEFIRRVLPTLARAPGARLRRTLTKRLAELCAQCHRAGVLQTDLHAGNVLVQGPAPSEERPATAGRPPLDEEGMRLYLIDLSAVRLRRRLSWRAARNNLAMLCAGLMEHSTRSDRWRFWRCYLAARGDLHISCPRRTGAQIEGLARVHSRRVVRGRDDRCLKVNGDFHRVQGAAGAAHALSGVTSEQMAELLRDPEAPLRHFRHRVEKISHSSVLVKAELPLCGGTSHVAYKQFRANRWWKRLLRWFRSDRAMDGWRRGHALLARGIATARPLIVCRPSGGRDSFLATEWINGAENLHLFLWRIAGLPPRQKGQLARQCIERLGALVGRLHAWRFAHRDLKAGNLVAAQSGDDVDVYLIDLDGLRLRRWLPRSTRACNLARLAASLELHPWITRPLRLRFFLAYLKHAGAPRGDWKRLWKEVARRRETILCAMRRRGRTVA